MAREILSKPGGGSPARIFGYAGGVDKFYRGWQLARTGPTNMLRNCTFESWAQGGGPTGRPDCWDWNSVGNLAQEGTTRFWGTYGLRVDKTSSDGAVTRVYQIFKQRPMPAGGWAGEKVFTFSVWCKTDQGSTARPFFYDGTNYKYGPYYTGGDEWQELKTSYMFHSSATTMDCGVEVDETASGTTVSWYFGCAQLVWGQAAYHWAENPEDRCLICQDWDDEGSHTEARGCMRAIPFSYSGTTTGGSGSELVQSVTLTYGCGYIIHVSTNLYSYTGAAPAYHQSWATNYSTTGFDLYLGRTDRGNIAASEDWVIDGCVFCLGWDNRVEQFK